MWGEKYFESSAIFFFHNTGGGGGGGYVLDKNNLLHTSYRPVPLSEAQCPVLTGCTSIFDDWKDTTVTPASMEHFLQYSVQEL